VTSPLGIVSRIVSSSRRRSIRAWLAVVSCWDDVGRHVIERAHQFSHFARGQVFDALIVFAGGNGIHGISERSHGAGNLLGKEKREPDPGEEDEDGHHQQEQEEVGTNLAAHAEKLPIRSGAGPDARRGLTQARGHWQARQHQVAAGGGEAERVILGANMNDRFPAAVGGREQLLIE
jgi:hypothetical protein